MNRFAFSVCKNTHKSQRIYSDISSYLLILLFWQNNRKKMHSMPSLKKTKFVSQSDSEIGSVRVSMLRDGRQTIPHSDKLPLDIVKVYNKWSNSVLRLPWRVSNRSITPAKVTLRLSDSTQLFQCSQIKYLIIIHTENNVRLENEITFEMHRTRSK